MNLKKIVGLLAIAFVLFFVITQPGSSANVVQGILGVLQDAAEAFAQFIQNLFT